MSKNPSDPLRGPPPHQDGEELSSFDPPQLFGEVASRSDDGGAPPRYRHRLSLPEAMLWQRLRQRPHGLKFRKQHRAAPYTFDFYCAQRQLVIEIDGEAHNRGGRPQRDVRRDAWCAADGLVVLRVPAADVLRSPDDTADAIARYALALPKAFDTPQRRQRTPSDPLRGPPPHQDGEERSSFCPPQLVGEVARSAGGALLDDKEA